MDHRVYLGVLEQKHNVFGVYAGSENGLLEIFFEFLDAVVVRHVYPNKR